MSTERNSIFKFGDLFEIDSPAGDWMAEARARREERERRQRTATNEQAQIYDRNHQYLNPETESACKDGGKTMLVLSDIVDPDEDKQKPGSARIDINMEYRVVTTGLGEVPTRSLLSSAEFKKLYSKGDRLEKDRRGKDRRIRLKTLPTKNLAGTPLSVEEIKQLNKKKKDPEEEVVWNYYNVTVQYDFSLEIKENYSLWEGILWLSDCVETRGIFLLLPFEKKHEERHEKQTMTLHQTKKELKKKEAEAAKEAEVEEKEFQRYTKSNLEKFRRTFQYEAYENVRVAYVFYVVKKLIESAISKKIRPKNKNLSFLIKYDGGMIEHYDNFYSSREKQLYLNISQLHKFLINHNMSLYYKKNMTNDIVWVGGRKSDEENREMIELGGFPKYYKGFIEKIQNFADRYYPAFKTGDWNSEEDAAAAGSNEKGSGEVNFIILNPKFFGQNILAAGFSFGELTPTEILVHEAGHNAAYKFRHTKKQTGDYEYKQEGLQSNQSESVYPTFDNTIGIISDPTNLANMTIAK